MMVSQKATQYPAVAGAVAAGLGRSPKSLPSWLFYDETGDKIFQEIMGMPEYYPTRCEAAILRKNREDLLKYFSPAGEPFRLIELGAGDGRKTEILLRHFTWKHASFTYLPIDISRNVLRQLSTRLQSSVPGLSIRPIASTYDQALEGLRATPERKVILFMGANIGNFSVPEATNFLKKIAGQMDRDDLLFIGYDLKKDPRIILSAYDDPHGITMRFNLNLLTRLNRELGAGFDIDQFSHYPYYDAETGATRSYLISLREQTVPIAALDKSYHFDAWETIQTEISQKYDEAMIEQMLHHAGLRIADLFYDGRQYCCNVLARPA